MTPVVGIAFNVISGEIAIAFLADQLDTKRGPLHLGAQLVAVDKQLADGGGSALLRLVGAIQKDILTVRPRRQQQLSIYPHSQSALNDQLQNFHMERGVLLPDGKIEMLLRATV